MTELMNSLPVLVVPFVTCLVIASLHCYMGLHVLRRGVIFVDLALAQTAALGAAVAMLLIPMIWPETLEFEEQHNLTASTEAALADALLDEDTDDLLAGLGLPETAGHDHPHGEGCEHDHGALGHAHGHGGHDHAEHDRFTYGMSLLFALLGAILLSFGRFRDERVPHEAIIGIIFVVCAALSVLILSKAPHGHDKMEAMLIGSILFTNWKQVIEMVLLYTVLGAIHIIFRKKFIAISANVAEAEGTGMKVKLWDCLFFTTFALMVTQSVSIAGVFVVFSYLIIPAACGSLFGNSFAGKLVMAWIVAVITTVAGLIVSALWDMPTGSSIVSCFGAALLVCSLIRVALGRSRVATA